MRRRVSFREDDDSGKPVGKIWRAGSGILLFAILSSFSWFGCTGGMNPPHEVNQGDNPYFHFLLAQDKLDSASGIVNEHIHDSEAMEAMGVSDTLESALREFRIVIDLDPGACTAREGAVECLLLLGRTKDAEKDIETALDTGCRSRYLFEKTGELAMAEGDTDRAIEAFSQAVEVDPDGIIIGIRLAELLAARGDKEAAVEVLRGMETDSPDLNNRIALWMAGLQEDVMDWKGALETVDKAVLMSGGDPGLFCFRGDLLSRMGDPAGARDDYLKALSIDPYNMDAVHGAAAICARTEDALCVNFLLGHLVRIGADDDPWHFYLRLAGLLLLDEPAKAEEVLERDGKGLEETAEFHYWAGRISDALGLKSDAVNSYERAVRLGNPDTADAALSLLVVLMTEEGRMNEAKKFLEESLNDDPDDPMKHFILGLVLFDLGELKSARDRMLDAERLGLIRNPYLELNLGSIFEKLGDYQAAADCLRKALKLDPSDYDAMNFLAYMNAELGVDLDESLVLAEKADSLSKDNPFILDTLAWIHYKKGNLDKALAYIEKALDLLRDPEILMHYGDILDAGGKSDEAVDRWNEAVERTHRRGKGKDSKKAFDHEDSFE